MVYVQIVRLPAAFNRRICFNSLRTRTLCQKDSVSFIFIALCSVIRRNIGIAQFLHLLSQCFNSHTILLVIREKFGAFHSCFNHFSIRNQISEFVNAPTVLQTRGYVQPNFQLRIKSSYCLQVIFNRIQFFPVSSDDCPIHLRVCSVNRNINSFDVLDSRKMPVKQCSICNHSYLCSCLIKAFEQLVDVPKQERFSSRQSNTIPSFKLRIEIEESNVILYRQFILP